MQTTVQEGNQQKQWGMLLAKSWADEELKTRLLADPVSVLEEHGIDVPFDVEVRIVENTDRMCHLVLPASPAGELKDEELSGAAGFYCYSGWCGVCGRCGCGCRGCFC